MDVKSRRLSFLLGGVVAALLLLAAPAWANHGRAGAAAGIHPVQARFDHRFYGVVPSARAGGHHQNRPTASEFSFLFDLGGNLNYSGGPVMQTNTTYAIYWEPSGYSGGSPVGDFNFNYQTLIDQFLADVANPSEQNSGNDVYSVDTQYYGPTGANIENASSFSSSTNVALDTDPLPADQCSSEYAGSGVTVAGCVTDAQIQAEVANIIAAHGWTPGPNALFFVFTPRNLGSCFDTSSGQCAFTYYCAYHSDFTDSSGGEVLYANQPYTETEGIGAPGVCASGQYPNGAPAADSTINVVSHEHNEAITDPLGSAWYDSSGYEIGDKCAWNFGSPLGSTSYGEYNQVINGDYYYLQQEWSNASSACALEYGAGSTPSLSLNLSPSSFAAGQGATGYVSIPSAASADTIVSLSSTGSGSLSSTTVTIPQGSRISSSFTYNNTKAQITKVTATATGYNPASQSETTTAGPATNIKIAPTSASLGFGGTQMFSAAGTDQYGNAATMSSSTWTVTPSTIGSLSRSTGITTTFTGSAQGVGTVTATIATPNGGTASASASVTVNPVADPIINGGFETGSLSGWSKSGVFAAENPVGTSGGYSCYAGAWCARLGSTTPTNGSSNIYQAFLAPTGSSSVSFYYEVVCPDAVQYDWATATLTDMTTSTTSTILPRTCNLNATWAKVSAAITPGHRYMLTLTSHDDGNSANPTYTLFDGVSGQ
jgi:hypothetical protein